MSVHMPNALRGHVGTERDKPVDIRQYTNVLQPLGSQQGFTALVREEGKAIQMIVYNQSTHYTLMDVHTP